MDTQIQKMQAQWGRNHQEKSKDMANPGPVGWQTVSNAHVFNALAEAKLQYEAINAAGETPKQNGDGAADLEFWIVPS